MKVIKIQIVYKFVEYLDYEICIFSMYFFLTIFVAYKRKEIGSVCGWNDGQTSTIQKRIGGAKEKRG